MTWSGRPRSRSTDCSAEKVRSAVRGSEPSRTTLLARKVPRVAEPSASLSEETPVSAIGVRWSGIPLSS